MEIDLYWHVMHALSADTEHISSVTSQKDGKQMRVRYATTGLNQWLAKVRDTGQLGPVECLALVLVGLRAYGGYEEERKEILNAWNDELFDAVATGEISARDRMTRLPIRRRPENWDWVMSIADADRFVKSRGMAWTCSGMVEQFMQAIKQAGPSDIAPWELFAVVNRALSGDGGTKTGIKAGDVQDAGHDWKVAVRLIADELDERDSRSGAWTSNAEMAARVAAVAIERGIRGPYGQLTAGNILRQALQGGRWQRKRKPPTT